MLRPHITLSGFSGVTACGATLRRCCRGLRPRPRPHRPGSPVPPARRGRRHWAHAERSIHHRRRRPRPRPPAAREPPAGFHYLPRRRVTSAPSGTRNLGPTPPTDGFVPTRSLKVTWTPAPGRTP